MSGWRDGAIVFCCSVEFEDRLFVRYSNDSSGCLEAILGVEHCFVSNSLDRVGLIRELCSDVIECMP